MLIFRLYDDDDNDDNDDDDNDNDDDDNDNNDDDDNVVMMITKYRVIDIRGQNTVIPYEFIRCYGRYRYLKVKWQYY